MKQIDCDIIQDLLPSYSDKISSAATNKLVEEHLKKCKKCVTVLSNMNEDIDITVFENQTEEVDYLKGYKKNKRVLIILSILLTIIVLVSVFIINILNKNILLDRLLLVDVNKFNVEYMYIKENVGKNESTGETFKYKTLQVYLCSEEYDNMKNMYLTGEYELETGDTEIYYNIGVKELPTGIEWDESGIELTFYIDDNTEKIFITNIKNDVREIWNKDMKVQSEEEWKQSYNNLDVINE